MPGSKKSKVKGGSRSRAGKDQNPPSRSARKGGQNDGFRQDSGTSFLTLQSVVRASHRNDFHSRFSGTNLRNQRMNFVSGNGLEGMETDIEIHSASPATTNNIVSHPHISEAEAASHSRAKPGGMTCTDLSVEHRDGKQDRDKESNGREGHLAAEANRILSCINRQRSPSPSRSESSDEVVLFRGRQTLDGDLPTKSRVLSSTQSTCVPASSGKGSLGVVTSQAAWLGSSIAPAGSMSGNELCGHRRPDSSLDRKTLHRGRKGSDTRAGVDEPHRNCQGPRQERPHQHRRLPLQVKRAEEHDNEIYADYIANSCENGNIALPGNRFSTVEHDLNGWQPSDIQDFGELSTSDEVLGGVAQVLSRRERASGLQYLVVWTGQTVDEARWINQSALTMDGAGEHIAAFEEEDKLTPEYEERSWETEDENDDGDEDIDSESDIEDSLELRRVDRMTDEQIARLLSKQEELGMGSNELFLFDQDVDDDFDGDDDNANIDLFGFAPSQRGRRRTNKRCSGSYIAHGIEEIGEDYGEFDVMDHERPSLLRGRHGGPDPAAELGLSDSSLEAELRASWAADRNKKKRKKRERQELRAQGLLGKKARVKPDFSAKYKDGMSIQMVRQELETFLEADYESRPFPPMDKRDRKMLHNFANAFNLKSKSQGKGSGRFTVVFKTNRTIRFDDDVFDRIATRLERQFWPTPGGSKGKKSLGQAQGRASGAGGWNVRDGQMVGAGAPELGSDNKGRAMLEKMGWTKGRALGTVENQGILLPIEHMVKTSKTGLG